MANEFIGRLDEIGLAKEGTSGTPESVGIWLPKAEGEYVPGITTDFFPGSYGTIDAVNKGEVTQLNTQINFSGSPTDIFFGHILMALFGSAYACVKIPITSASDDFVEGETITESTSSATGVLRRLDQESGESTGTMYLDPVSGTFTGGETLTGGTSSATATGGTIESPSAVNSHVFRRLNTNNHPAYTIYNHSPVEDVRASYCMLESLEIEAMPDKFIQFNARFIGKNFASTSAQTPSYGSENFFFGKSATFKMEAAFDDLDGGDAVTISRMKLSFTKSLELYPGLGSVDLASLHNTEWDVKGDFEMLFNAATQRGYVTGGTERALRLSIINTTTIGSAAKPTIQFDIPSAFFTEFQKPTPQGEIVKQTLGFTGQKDSTRGFPCEGLLTNTRVVDY